MEAAYKNEIGTVKLLIENGADLNAKDKNGETALELAKRKGYENVVKLLRSAGAV